MTAGTEAMAKPQIDSANAVLPKGWTPSDESYSANDVIDAYFAGRDTGEEAVYDKAIQQYKIKIRTATAVVEELTSVANESGYQFLTAFLRYLGHDSFEAVYLVPEDLYLSDNMKPAMRLARDFKQKYRSEDFMITFLFMPHTTDLDVGAMVTDGFYLKTI